jgi:uncharacterized membrane protein YphA (DoxX/SURF4 family)
VTTQLFANEYNLPFINPSIAAPLATAAEFAGSVLIFLGLFSRGATLMLLGVVSVIVYPENWGRTSALGLVAAFRRLPQRTNVASTDALFGLDADPR